MGSEPAPARPRNAGDAHVAVLLAAGGSTRLGRPKQLLTREDEPLVRRVARLMLETAPRELVVVLGAHAGNVAAALRGLPHRAVFNEAWPEGLGGSLRRAAEVVAAPRVLIAVCDQPALGADHLHALLAAAPCAATSHGGRPGVPAVVDAELWARAASLSGDRGLAPLLAARPDLAMLSVPALEHDLDTPEQCAEARARGWID